MNINASAKWNPGNFAQLLSNVKTATAVGVTSVAMRILDTSQELVPVDTGELRESGHIDIQPNGDEVSASVTYDASHAAYVEFGTGQSGESSPGAGPGPYKQGWPGMPAQPYLRPAFDAHRDQATDVVAGTISSAIK
jgi:HK97 gp10 family phage protein